MSALKDKIAGNWNLIKGKLKEEYAELTDNDLMYQEGQEDQLVGLIQKKTGQTKEAIENWFDQFQN